MDQLLKFFDLSFRDLFAIPVAIVWFFVLYKSLKVLVFDPYLKLQAMRDTATVGAIERAHTLAQQAALIENEIESALKTSKERALARRDTALGEARKEAETITANGENEAQAIETKERTALQEEKLVLEQAVVTESEKLASLVSSRISEIAG